MKRLSDDAGLVVLTLLLVIGVTFLLVPLVVAAGMSFDARDFLGPFPPPALSLYWYQQFWTNEFYLNGIRTSLAVAFVATVTSTVVGSAAALIIHQYRFAGRDALAAFLLSPMIIPHVVLGFALLMAFSQIGIFNGALRLIVGHVVVTLPYAIRATLAGLIGIKPSLVQAALSLGATERRAFWKVTFPLARTGMVTGAIFAFAFSMDDVSTSLFLTDPNYYTLPVAMANMMRSSLDLSIAAASMLLMTLTLALIFVLDRYVGLDTVVGAGIYRA